MAIQECGFRSRLAQSDKGTTQCVDKLVETQHIACCKKAVLERDIENGVDFDFDYSGSANVPVQFKVRMKHPDIPVVIAQPFWGYGHERTTPGRDLKCLLGHKTKYHYVGIFDNGCVKSIYYAHSKSVEKESVKALKVWYEAETNTASSQYGKSWFTPELVAKWMLKVRNRRIFTLPNGVEIWWKKNDSERFAKLNMYIPMGLVRGVMVYDSEN